jgi:NhaP-type Na+/H+ or K+/H+ antiporter
MLLLAVFVLVVFAYSLVSRRLERTIVTAPLLFAAAGALTSFLPEALRELMVDRSGLLLVAEIGLVMTLFTDASRISPRMLRANGSLPVRMLSTGMLLTILLGTLAAKLILPGLGWWEAAILGAVLAPTDAGLGQVIVNSPRVPLRIREALNVEAGLNDGLSVPFLLLFIALAMAHVSDTGPGLLLARFLGEQLGLGALIGAGVGLAGGWLLGLARRKGWASDPLTQLGVVALPLLCMIASEAVEASMFIAAFVAGIAVQAGFREVGRHSVEFTEDWGQLFNFFVFFLFGLIVARECADVTPALLFFAAASLTVVRMLPVALALRGTGLSRSTILFMGWFGPRGLASIVLGMVYLEQQANLPGDATMRLAVMATVLMSIVAHGMSALPGAAAYEKRVAALDPSAPEHEAVEGSGPGRNAPYNSTR